MAQFAPIILNTNGGEVSPALHARVDHEKYSSWAETVENFILTPQGMLSKRPGSKFINRCISNTFVSELIPFEYSNSETYVLEFGETEIRFYTNDGVIVEAAQPSATLASSTVVNSTAHTLSANDYVYLSSIAASNDNGKIIKVSSVNVNDFTLAEALDVSTGALTVQKVYQIAHPYTGADLVDLQYVQSGNVLWLFHKDYEPRTLTRSGNASWAIATYPLKDGPYEDINDGNTILTLSASGDLGRMSGTTVTASTGTAADAVDGDASNHWIGSTGVKEWVRSDLGAGNSTRIVGYVLAAPSDNATAKGPGSWRVQGSDNGTTWFSVDKGFASAVWAPEEYKYFPVSSSNAYRYWRLIVDEPYDESQGALHVGWWGVCPHPDDSPETITLTASNTTDINDGSGFQASDVGRAIRLLTASGHWVWCKITAHTSTTVVSVVMQDFPLDDDLVIQAWRMSKFSTNGVWPDAGVFFQNRLGMGGGDADIALALSKTDIYDLHAPTDPEGVVVDDDAINTTVLSRMADGIRWVSDNNKDILVGAGSDEWVIQAASADKAISPTNIRAARISDNGSQRGLRPAKAGSSVLFFDKTKNRLRELAYVFETDSYRSPDMTLLADHMFQSSSACGIAYLATPYPIVWTCRADGQMPAMSYAREHEVTGWTRQILGGFSDSGGTVSAKVKKVVGVTNTAGDGEDLWMVVERYINGSTVYYLETIGDYFNEGTALEDAFFVDSGVTYDGSAATVIGNLWHLEGEAVLIFADGEIVTGKTVSSGQLTLSTAAAKVHIGYQMDSVYKSLPIRVQVFDGTGQGRAGRIYEVVFNFWRTYGGSFGPDSSTTDTINFIEADTFVPGSPPPFKTGLRGPLAFPGAHDKQHTIYYAHSDPTPCNIRAIYPRMEITDHG